MLFIFSWGSTAAQTDLAGDDIDRISQAVVRIVALVGGEVIASGSGTVVASTGLIYTNRHVVEGADDYSIEFLDDLNELPLPRYRARLVGYSMDVDFALLQVDRDIDGQPVDVNDISLPFLSSVAQDARRGDDIFVLGYPSIGDGYLAFTQGTLTSIRNGTMSDRRLPVWYQTDAQISPGNSGGLAVNVRGEMVGMPTRVWYEEPTGGRLGGILTINAIQAALDDGLETDVSRIAAATASPVIEGGILDFRQSPTFDSVDLTAGFSEDPYALEIVSGGEVAVGYLGDACTGYAAVAPDVRLNWSGSSSELRFFFVGDDGGDTTLLVNLPNGSWVCNDDSESLDPMVIFEDPIEGQYDIWVGSFDAGAFVSGALNITERNLDPVSAGATELDYSSDPFYGTLRLNAGFTADPNLSKIFSGGTVDVSYLGGDCVGHASAAADVRLIWSGSSNELRVFFRTGDSEDTSLIINNPNGSWVCNDDSESLDPMVIFEDPIEGQYDIWVGSYQRGESIVGELGITELDIDP